MKTLLLPMVLLFIAVQIGDADAAKRKRLLRIAILGDEMTANADLPEKARYGAVLERGIVKTMDIIYPQVKSFSTRDLSVTVAPQFLPAIIAYQPTLAMIQLGRLEGKNKADITTTKNALENILIALRDASIFTVVLAPSSPHRSDIAFSTAYENIFANAAQRYGAMYVANFVQGLEKHPTLLLPDGEYPNEKGVQAMVRSSLRIINQAVIKLIDARVLRYVN